jgi:hypothetical protein
VTDSFLSLVIPTFISPSACFSLVNSCNLSNLSIFKQLRFGHEIDNKT